MSTKFFKSIIGKMQMGVVNPHWTGLVLGWETACGQVNRLGV